MIDWSPGPPLDGDTASRIGVDRMAGSRDANSDFCATSLAMASHDLRQPLQVIVDVRPCVASRVSRLSPNVVQVDVIVAAA
jgi:hypothetical protein